MVRFYIKFLLFALSFSAFNSNANTIILYIDSLNQTTQNIVISGCDTLVVINNSNLSDYFFLDTIQGGRGDFNTQIYPDLMIGSWGLDTSYFYNFHNYTNLFIAHQMHETYFNINIIPCITSINKYITLDISIKIFPNPTSEIVCVESIDEIVSINILNALGQSVMSTIHNHNKANIDINNLKNGIYYIQINNQSGKQHVKQFIKSN
jgi:hypothetical protein